MADYKSLYNNLLYWWQLGPAAELTAIAEWPGTCRSNANQVARQVRAAELATRVRWTLRRGRFPACEPSGEHATSIHAARGGAQEAMTKSSEIAERYCTVEIPHRRRFRMGPGHG